MGKILKIVQTALPLLIIGTLLYIALFVQPTPSPTRVEVPSIESRDHFYGITTPASTIIWAVASHGKVVRSEDSGKTWITQKTPTIAHLQSIHAWDDQKAVAVGNAGVVIVTDDGGKTWKEVDVPKHEIANKLLNVRGYPGGIAWAVGEFGAVLRSADYGWTWTRVIEAEDVGLNDIYFVGDKGCIVGEFGTIKITDDGGKIWENIDPVVETSLMAVAFRDQQNGVIVGLEGMVLKTEDGGKTWTEAPRPTKIHLYDILWDKDDSLWIASGDVGLLYKADPSITMWKGGRMDDMVLTWFVEAQKVGDRIYLAGGKFGYFENGKLTLYN